MRFRIVIPVLLLGMALVGAALFFRTTTQPPTTTVPAATEASVSAAPTPAVTVKAHALFHPVTDQPIALAASAPAEEEDGKNQYVQNRTSELFDLAMRDDPASLQEILGELDNPEPRIRKAAVDAAVQFKSPDAIPALKDVLAQATELDEKVNLQKAIDFLSLSLPPNATNSNP